MLGTKQGSCECQFSKVLGLTWHGNRTSVYRFRGIRSNHYAIWSVLMLSISKMLGFADPTRSDNLIKIIKIQLNTKIWRSFIRIIKNRGSLVLVRISHRIKTKFLSINLQKKLFGFNPVADPDSNQRTSNYRYPQILLLCITLIKISKLCTHKL